MAIRASRTSTPAEPVSKTPDPVHFKDEFWPDVRFYDKQWDVIYSVIDNDETVVPAGNKLGKDFVAGFVCLYFFLTRPPLPGGSPPGPCRVITTSAKEDHLRVLWGEIGQFIASSRYPLDYRKGGPLIINHQDVRLIRDGRKCSKSYMLGMVANPDTIAAMQGHHIANPGDGVPRTLFACDESSSVPNDYYQKADTWADRKYIFGNTWPCDNFFKWAVEGRPGTEDRGGDVPRPVRADRGEEPGDRGYYRKVIRIRAEDSPNVKLALAQQTSGAEPTGETVLEGVKGWDEYLKNRQLWDPVQQAVSLDAVFYKGGEVLMYPPDWLNHSERLFDELRAAGTRRRARAMGVDPGEGGAETSWSIGDDFGLVEQINMKTPDTSVIPATTIALITRYGIDPKNVAFDRGGGGKQVADQLRAKGFPVTTVAFGEGVSGEMRRGPTPFSHRVDVREDHYAYTNRRAEMYGTLMEYMNPGTERTVFNPSTGAREPYRGFALPRSNPELRRQLAPVPKTFDAEGRLKIPPKNKRSPDSRETCLTDLLGCSPDRADSLVLMLHVLDRRPAPTVGAY
jgi:hypothetical protein